MKQQRIWEAGTRSAALDDVIEENVREAITSLFKDRDAWSFYGYFPHEWYPSDGGHHGKAPDDPLVFRVSCDGDEQWSMDESIDKLLRESANQCAQDGSWLEGLKHIAKALRALVDHIDECVAVRDGLEEGVPLNEPRR